MMTGKLLAQLGWVAERDADRQLPDPYEWPKVSPPPTSEQLAEAARLRAIANDCFRRAREAGITADGTDFIFGDELQPAAMEAE